MIKRFTLMLLASAALSTSACAAEKPADVKQVSTAAADTEAAQAIDFSAPDSAWRDTDPENTIYIDTNRGRMIVELYPNVAPAHVERIKTLARQKFYDYITFHRVIEDFMNQTGDPKGDGTGDSDLPDLPGEFTFRRPPDMGVTLVGSRPIGGQGANGGEVGVGFYKALPVATQPSAQAILTKDGKVLAFGLHCKGVTSMARSDDPNSANSQFFLMRGKADHLDAKYSVWGTTVWGRENLLKIKVGAKSDDPTFVPDKMEKVRVEADLPEEERVHVQVLDTESPAFKNYLKTFKKEDGTYPDICDIEVPSRLKP